MDSIPLGSNVAAYYRNSSDMQINSLPDQAKMLDHTVKDFQMELVHTFTDEGISGSTIDERGGMQALLAKAEELKKMNVKYLLIPDVSRMSRGGNQDFWTIIRILKRGHHDLFMPKPHVRHRGKRRDFRH